MSVNHPIDADGTWIEWRRSMPRAERILFCDRDGVIIHDRNYLSDPDGVELIDGIVDICRAAEDAGVPVVVVTNQSGIGRGYFGWDEFAAVQARMLDLLSRAGVEPSAILACPHHPQALAPYRHPDPPMRKPNPGMLLAAARICGIDLTGSLLIGDRRDDLRAAERAGLRRGILVETTSQAGSSWDGRPDFVVERADTVRAALPVVTDWIGQTASSPP